MHEHQVLNPDSNLDHNVLIHVYGGGGLSLDLSPCSLPPLSMDLDLD